MEKYDATEEKICNWGNYRVLSVECTFDRGTAELNVAPQYKAFGW